VPAIKHVGLVGKRVFDAFQEEHAHVPEYMADRIIETDYGNEQV
jgi:hypothetical protein